MKEALNKMEEKQKESQQIMGGVINLLQHIQMKLNTLSASMDSVSTLVQ